LLRHDPADLGQRRYRRILLTTASSWLGKAVSVSVNLVSIPLAAHYLGLERYGLWLVAGSILGWLSLTDLGLGNHLTTLLAQASGRGDREKEQLYAATALWTLGGIAAVIGLLAAICWPLIPWDRVFNVNSPLARAEAPVVAVILLTSTLANLPLSLANRIYYAYQEGWKGNLWQVGASLASLLALLIVVRSQAGLPGLAIALAGTPLLVTLVNMGYLLTYDKPWLLASPRIVRLSTVKTVMSGGFWMLMISLQSFFWLGKDNILIGQLFGPEEVGPYNTAFRLFFSLLGLLVSQIAISMWPAYAEAAARYDWQWMERAFKRSLVVTLSLYAAIAFLIAAFAQPLIRIWAGEKLVPHPMVPWLLALEFVVLAWTNISGYLLVAIQRPQILAISGLVSGILGIGIAIVLVKPLGILSVPVGNIISSFVFMAVPSHAIATRFLSANDGVSSAAPFVGQEALDEHSLVKQVNK
jgi:O-antigen/teichoic acid export membrane protein